MKHFRPILLLLLVAGGPATKPALKSTFPSLDDLQSSGDFFAAETQLQNILDQTIAYSLPKDADVIRDADFSLRLVHQLRSVPNNQRRVELFKFLRSSENLSRSLVFLILPKQDPGAVYALLDRLRQKRADQLDKFASLAAAICVVHDRPLSR